MRSPGCHAESAWGGRRILPCLGRLTRGLLPLLALLLATGVASASPPGPDNPPDRFWFRNPLGPPPHSSTMDPRLQEIADAFGVSDYQTTRQLANLLLESTTDPTLRSEAAAFIIESRLAEGEFDGARAEAQRLGDQESLTRLDKLEADYEAEVAGLQEVIARSSDPHDAAAAQLALADAHCSFGKVRLACEIYARAIHTSPDEPLASAAASRLIAIYERQGGPASAAAVAEWILGAFAHSPWACLAPARTVARARVQEIGAGAAASHVARRVETATAQGAKLAFQVALAEIEEDEGRLAEARHIYRSLLREAPPFAGHVRARHHVYRLAQLDCRIFEQAVLHVENPRDYQGLVRRAEAFLAEEDLQPEVEWPLRASLAKCLVGAGGGMPQSVSQGIYALRALALERPSVPEAGEAYRVLGLLLADADRCEEAIEAWRIALEVLPNSLERADIAIRLGDLFSSRDQMVDARKSYEHALQCPDPDLQASGHQRLARLREMEGDLPAALQHYEAAVRISPASFAGETASQRLDQLQKEESP